MNKKILNFSLLTSDSEIQINVITTLWKPNWGQRVGKEYREVEGNMATFEWVYLGNRTIRKLFFATFSTIF